MGSEPFGACSGGGVQKESDDFFEVNELACNDGVDRDGVGFSSAAGVLDGRDAWCCPFERLPASKGVLPGRIVGVMPEEDPACPITAQASSLC